MILRQLAPSNEFYATSESHSEMPEAQNVPGTTQDHLRWRTILRWSWCTIQPRSKSMASTPPREAVSSVDSLAATRRYFFRLCVPCVASVPPSSCRRADVGREKAGCCGRRRPTRRRPCCHQSSSGQKHRSVGGCVRSSSTLPQRSQREAEQRILRGVAS